MLTWTHSIVTYMCCKHTHAYTLTKKYNPRVGEMAQLLRGPGFNSQHMVTHSHL